MDFLEFTSGTAADLMGWDRRAVETDPHRWRTKPRRGSRCVPLVACSTGMRMPLSGFRSQFVWVREAKPEGYDTAARGRTDHPDRTGLMLRTAPPGWTL